MSDVASKNVVFVESKEEVVDVVPSAEIVSEEDVVDAVSLSEMNLLRGELNDEKKSKTDSSQMLSTIEPFGDSDVVVNGETGVMSSDNSDTEVVGDAQVSLTVNDLDVLIKGKIGVDSSQMLSTIEPFGDSDVVVNGETGVMSSDTSDTEVVGDTKVSLTVNDLNVLIEGKIGVDS